MFAWVWAKLKKLTGGIDLHFIDEVQRAVVSSCNFVPLASTVAAIVFAQTGVGTAALSALAVANKICTALKAARATSGLTGEASTVPDVDGVPVEGFFIK